jgi:hypothetical protein
MPAPKEGYRLLVIDPARDEVWASLDVGLPPGSFPVSSTILGGRAFVSVTCPRDGRSLVLSIDLTGNERKCLELAGRNPGIITALPASEKLALCDNSLDMRGKGSLWIIDPLSLSIENELSIPGGAGYLREAEKDSVYLTVGYYFGEPRLSELDIKTLSLRQITGSPTYSGSDEAGAPWTGRPTDAWSCATEKIPPSSRWTPAVALKWPASASITLPRTFRKTTVCQSGSPRTGSRLGLRRPRHHLRLHGNPGMGQRPSRQRPLLPLLDTPRLPGIQADRRQLYFIDSNDILVHEASGDFGRIATIPLG